MKNFLTVLAVAIAAISISYAIGISVYPKSELRRVETTDKHFGTQMRIVVQSEVKGFFG
jgi:hypothetical protein